MFRLPRTNTLVLFTADNGGIGRGNNHGLRGHKHDPWQGGTRVAAFVSGGFVPAALRGTESGNKFVHISDWYVVTAPIQDIRGVSTHPGYTWCQHPSRIYVVSAPIQDIRGDSTHPGYTWCQHPSRIYVSAPIQDIRGVSTHPGYTCQHYCIYTFIYIYIHIYPIVCTVIYADALLYMC
jgi:hypothetical protein